MAAAGFEIWLAARQHPRRFLYAWIAWTPCALAVILQVNLEAGDLIGGVLWGLILSPLAYPVIRGFILLRFHTLRPPTFPDGKPDEIADHAVDFDGPARPAPAVVDRDAPAKPVAPMVVAAPSAHSRLDRVVTETRPGWIGRAEIGLVAGLCALIAALYATSMTRSLWSPPPPTHEEMIATTLEQHGLHAPRIIGRGEVGADGYSMAYAWSAAGAEGRACVNAHDGTVSAWTTRKWPNPAAATSAHTSPTSPHAPS